MQLSVKAATLTGQNLYLRTPRPYGGAASGSGGAGRVYMRATNITVTTDEFGVDGRGFAISG
jgi:hypothetical protein